jgi:hypothetical protein
MCTRKLTFLFLAVVLSGAAALTGCGPFWVNPYITVEDSPLNWVEIHYYNTSRKPVRRIGVYLTGMGHVEVRKGTSDLVSNDFAKRYRDETWADIKTHRLTVDPAHVKDIFQNLVNHGLLDREKTGRRSKKTSFDRFIAVKANICNNTYSEPENIFEVDPDLAEQLLDVIRQFDNPVR